MVKICKYDNIHFVAKNIFYLFMFELLIVKNDKY